MKNVKNFDQLLEEAKFGDAYQKWEKDFKGRPVQEAMQALENHPDKEGIKKAHDLQHIWEWWTKNQSSSVRPSIHVKNAERYEGWNNWSPQVCGWLMNADRNPFQESCIIPDWRSPRMIKADNEALIAIDKEPE